MFRKLVFFFLVLITSFCFAQQNNNFSITGRIPDANNPEMYRVQVGAFRISSNVNRVLERLRTVNINPITEIYNDLTRVIIICNAGEVPVLLDILKNAGFTEAFIRADPLALVSSMTLPVHVPEPVQDFMSVQPAQRAPVRLIEELPVSTALIPEPSLIELASRTIRVNETRSLNDLVEGMEVTSWISSTPSSATVDSDGNVTGLTLGNTYITVNNNVYISVAIVPQEIFFIVPESMTSLLPVANRRPGSSVSDFTEYRTEPTYRLSYRFNNKGESKGASGGNGGIDILARGKGYNWLWTTYYQGGWFYDLNGVRREMINGYQMSPNGVSLTLAPEFVYENGIPYLQLKHFLYNSNDFAVTNQRFGASADVMIHNNDNASLMLTPYGAYMTDNLYNPSIELMFVCLEGGGITPVDTLWLGTYSGGAHLDYTYTDNRIDVHNRDSAIGFSYQNINLNPGETKEFIVRFTLARHE